MKPQRAILAAIVFLTGFCYRAEAVPILVQATGTIYEGYDYVSIFGLGVGSLEGRTVIATWAFDTDDVAADYYLGLYPDLRWYVDHDQGAPNWIHGSVTLAGASNTLEDFAYARAEFVEVGDGDIPYLNGIPSGRDSFFVNAAGTTTERSSPSTAWFRSIAGFVEYEDNVVHGLSAGQVFEWSDNDATDYGIGEFMLRLGDTDVVYGLYHLNSMRTSVSVIEPTTLSLLAVGLLGLGLTRRPDRAPRNFTPNGAVGAVRSMMTRERTAAQERV